jgi:hypothetical protein
MSERQIIMPTASEDVMSQRKFPKIHGRAFSIPSLRAFTPIHC